MIQYQIYLGMHSKKNIITSEMILDFLNKYVVNNFTNFTVIEGYGYWNKNAEKVSIITIITKERNDILYNKIKKICLDYKNLHNQECVLFTETILINYEMVYM
jgi:hypothetical protein